MNHHHVHVVVDLGGKAAEKVESGIKVARAVSASEAFRKYDWLKSVPMRNASGNFRGMIVSKKWATVFHFSEKVLKPLEKITLLASLAENIARAYHPMDSIIGSRDGWDIKAARLSTEVSSIALRTVGGVIPAGAHMLATSLRGYCQIARLAGSQGALAVDQTLRDIDAFITTSFDKVTDGKNIQIFINNYLVIR
jgi:hypothetical protein